VGCSPASPSSSRARRFWFVHAVTDADGTYRLANLPPGTYEARAELSGFETAVRSVPVRVGATLTVDFNMSVGSIEETITVTGEAPIVDPERAASRSTSATRR